MRGRVGLLFLLLLLLLLGVCLGCGFVVEGGGGGILAVLGLRVAGCVVFHFEVCVEIWLSCGGGRETLVERGRGSLRLAWLS